jgi:hypothetical protein
MLESESTQLGLEVLLFSEHFDDAAVALAMDGHWYFAGLVEVHHSRPFDRS